MPICQGWHRFWWTGIVLFVVGNGFNFVSFSYAKQSLLAALGSYSLPPTSRSASSSWARCPGRGPTGTATIIAGNVVIVMVADGYFGDKDAWCNMTLYTANELAELYLEPAWCLPRRLRRRRSHRAALARRDRVLAAPERDGARYVLASAVVGTQSVTTKSVSELLRDTLSGRNQLHYAFTYVVLFATAGTASFWVYRMDLALKFDALFIIPLLQVAWTTLSIVGGGIYYKEFDDYDAFNVALFFACSPSSSSASGRWRRARTAPRTPCTRRSRRSAASRARGRRGARWTRAPAMSGAGQGGAVAADGPANPGTRPRRAAC